MEPKPLPPSRRRRWLLAFAILGALVGLWHTAYLWLPPAVDVARGWVGFAKMHRLEQAVFEILDQAQRLGEPESPVRPIHPPPSMLSALWPPSPLLPVLTLPGDQPGEGAWRSIVNACLPDSPGALDQSSPMVRTFIRVDPVRPDTSVTLVAMDLRRLQLHIQAGTDDAAAGRIDPGLALTVVAAFNGGFQSHHGHFGLRSRSQTLLEPLPDAATVATDRNGRLWLGPWPTPGDDPALTAHLTGLRQNLQLLQDGPQVISQLSLLADGREEVIGHSVTRRSGLCIKPPFTLIYAWTLRGRAQALGDAMVAAGCLRGMHLDLNAFHTCFEFLNLSKATPDEDGAWQGACAERLEPRMTDNPLGRYLAVQRRDFFIVTLRPEPLSAPILPELPIKL